MAKCLSCGSQNSDNDAFCGNCGTPLPRDKECPQCGKKVSLDTNFCNQCGYNFNKSGNNNSGKTTGLSMGDKNVFAGDVVGNQENYHIAGSAVIIKNTDESKTMVKCHICGHQIPIINSVECPECNLTVCEDCFAYDQKSCINCLQRKNRDKEEIFLRKLEETRGVISLENRRVLAELQKSLNLDDQTARNLEIQVVSKYQNSQQLSSYAQITLTQAMEIFYEQGNARKAYELLRPLYNTNSYNESVFEAFIQVAIRANHQEAVKIIRETQVDSPGTYFARIDYELEKNNLAAADTLLHSAIALWPDNILMLCRKIQCLARLADEMHNNAMLAEAQQILASLPKATGSKLEASWLFKAQAIIMKASGTEIAEITAEYCRSNNLYYFIAAPEKINVINVPHRESLTETQRILLKKAERGSWDSLTKLLQTDDKNTDIYLEALKNAADNDDVEAQYYTGECYFYGWGFKQNYSEALEWYKIAAESGHIEAIHSIGFCCYQGLGIPQDYSEAVKYFRISADNGNRDAQYFLGECYFYNRGVDKKNLVEALKYYHQAAEQGHIEALNRLGDCYLNGEGTQKNLTMAAHFYQQAAEQGHTEAQNSMGCLYYNGELEQDYGKALEYFRQAAEQNNLNATVNLGLCLQYGHGIARDAAKAVEYYKIAADQGHVTSQYLLARCYYNNNDIQSDFGEAFKYFKLAAENNHIEAHYYLGLCYENGNGVNKNPAAAVHHYQIAADKGDCNAQINLGYCYEHGNGVNKNLAAAFKYYKAAADQGGAVGQYNAAVFYQYGQGTAKDPKMAFKYYLLAAEQGYKSAINSVGNCYLDGIGVEKNYTRAAEYYKAAVEKGVIYACTNLGICYEYGYGVKKNYRQALKYYRHAFEQFSKLKDDENSKSVREKIIRCKGKRKLGKKIFWLLVLAGAVFFWFKYNGKDKVSGIVQEAKEIVAPSPVENLETLGKALLLYRDFNDGSFPSGTLKTGRTVGKDGAAAIDILWREAYLTPMETLIVRFDQNSKPAGPADQITAENTSYVYVGSGLKDASLPLAFEKPWLIPKGTDEINVLFGSGEVKTIQYKSIRNMTCRKFLNFLLKNKNVPNARRKIMFACADVEDQIHRQSMEKK